jgi:L,D-transpeptidase ErfK/SrfK
MKSKHFILLLIISAILIVGTIPLAFEIDTRDKYYQIVITNETPTIKEAIKKSTEIITESVLDDLTKELKDRYWLYDVNKIEEGATFETFLSIPENYLVNKKDLEMAINVPERKVYLYQNYDDEKILLKKYSCAVGKAEYKTPIGPRKISYIKWNPWWYPPPSEWAKKEKITPPGPKNPLGKVAMVLGDCLNLHGTNSPQSIGRVISHGCMRMHNADAIEIAAFLQKNDSASEFDKNSFINKTFNYAMKKPIPVNIIYETVILDEENLTILPDIYEFGKNTEETVLNKLEDEGFDLKKVDRKKISLALKNSGLKKQTLPLAELIKEEIAWEETETTLIH